MSDKPPDQESRQIKLLTLASGDLWAGAETSAGDARRIEPADLAVTTDYRTVLTEIMAGHMGLPDPAQVFPGFATKPLGIWG